MKHPLIELVSERPRHEWAWDAEYFDEMPEIGTTFSYDDGRGPRDLTVIEIKTLYGGRQIPIVVDVDGSRDPYAKS